jgi:branched-chain amino acid transport system permease protein
MTENTTATLRSGDQPLKVTRSRRNTLWTSIGALVVVVVLFLFPFYIGSGSLGILVQGLIILTLASMWNLLAGYAGLVSVGQQAFLGLGAYFVLIPAMHGITPWAGLFIATAGAAVCALPLWWLVARLRLGYFAIATWVLASVVMLIIEQISSIGGGTGEPLPGLEGKYQPAVLTAYTYWAALIIAVLAIGGVYFLLRSRVGLVLTAIRDDERAARSSGVRVGTARLLVFIVAAAGCGAAGGVLAIQQLGVTPGTSGGVFSVQWTAEMAFAVIIGGIGTIEGPIIGTIVFMVLQQTLQSYNAWYLIILGLVAIVIAIFARRGLWGTLDERFNIRLFPVGYHLWTPGERRGRKRVPTHAA